MLIYLNKMSFLDIYQNDCLSLIHKSKYQCFKFSFELCYNLQVICLTMSGKCFAFSFWNHQVSDLCFLGGNVLSLFGSLVSDSPIMRVLDHLKPWKLAE